MSAFRELVSEMDEAIFEALSDDELTIDGRPVLGMFSAPWIAPKIGRLRTEILEPQVAVLDGDAVGVENGSVVEFNHDRYEVVAVEPDGTGITDIVLRPM